MSEFAFLLYNTGIRKLKPEIIVGMFDYFRSSYDLGETFTNVVCQTKGIDDYDLGGTMTDYWLDPNGLLWCPSYKNTHLLDIYEKDDPRFDPEYEWNNYKWIKTGVHGKYKPHLLTKYIEVYPDDWKGDWDELPRLRLHFKHGILQDYEEMK